MKYMKKVLVALLVLSMLLSYAAMAETFVKFKGNAWCYKKAGSKKTDICIKKGSVTYTDSDKLGSKWTKVYVDEDTELWVKSKFLKKLDVDDDDDDDVDDDDDDGDDEDTSEMKVMFVAGGSGRSTYDEDEGSESYKTSKKYLYATGKCNIRKSPSLEGDRIGSLKKGARIRYLGRRAEDDRGVYWYKVKTSKGKTGWISEAFTKFK